jgi:hypothetical protein
LFLRFVTPGMIVRWRPRLLRGTTENNYGIFVL